jgi:uncharacterized protein (DUF924 family)
MADIATPAEILAFWFGPLDEYGNVVEDKTPMWWQKHDEIDAEIRARFEATVQAARRGELDAWQETPDGRVALIVALDQFPRNIYRGTAEAFASDGQALTLAQTGIEQNHDQQVPFIYRLFFYLPLEHAEDRAVQAQSVGHFVQLREQAPAAMQEAAANYLDYAKQHQVIIDRFGRFPHRNAILKRAPTDEEEAFLQEPNSSF